MSAERRLGYQEHEALALSLDTCKLTDFGNDLANTHLTIPRALLCIATECRAPCISAENLGCHGTPSMEKSQKDASS